ncbi:receptor-like protein 43 [Arachis stenosperma]|uniref:receptor-like protein 43 n=1 Tax=Arachis stenosperma TaxID=217475 RepID=UPI0025AD9B0D|nr:receptor-like protein 43 [Arachis stenosperma]
MGYLMLLVLRVVLCVYMFVMFHFACLSSSHLCHSQDSSALLHFKTHFIFNTSFFEYEYEYECSHVYPKMSMWENGTDCCSWMGVTCHSVSGHVIGLDLSCSALVGIRGHLTSHILYLPNLYALKLSGNGNIQVHVPKLNCTTSLSFLDLSSCQFSGSQIPDSFSNLTQLTFLYLPENGFNGSIPSLLSNLQHLTHLDLSGNAFTGSFPSFLSNLHHLVYLDLSFNKLSGQIPNVFDRLTNLQ